MLPRCKTQNRRLRHRQNVIVSSARPKTIVLRSYKKIFLRFLLLRSLQTNTTQIKRKGILKHICNLLVFLHQILKICVFLRAICLKMRPKKNARSLLFLALTLNYYCYFYHSGSFWHFSR